MAESLQQISNDMDREIIALTAAGKTLLSQWSGAAAEAYAASQLRSLNVMMKQSQSLRQVSALLAESASVWSSSEKSIAESWA